MNFSKIRYRFSESIFPHTALLIYTAIALFPIFLVIINSFKARKAIFRAPLALPNSETFSLEGYLTVWERAGFPLYFRNSLVVTIVSIFCILLFGAMAAYALSEYKFRGNTMLGLYLALGIMIPIRLGTVGILRLVASMNLVNTLGAQQFLGQFVSDWNAVLSSLTLAMIPVLILYIIFSRQLIRGITSGAVK